MGHWFRRQWFLAGLVLVLAIAILAPDVGRGDGPLSPGRWRGWLVASIFLISGLELRTSQLGEAVRDYRLHVFVQGLSLLICPLFFWCVAQGLAHTGLPWPLIEGVVVLGCLPTTVTSGVAFTRVSGGDEAGALFNATLGNLMGVVVSPIWILLLTGQQGNIPLEAVAPQLAWQVAAPVGLGQAIQLVLARYVPSLRVRLGNVAGVLLLVLIYFVFCDSLSQGVRVGAAHVLAAISILAALHGALLLIAFRSSGLPIWHFSRAKRTAAVICSTQKTAALGVPMIAIVYANRPELGLVTLPLLVYHPLQLLVAGAAVDAWRRYNGTDRPLSPTTSQPAGDPPR
ncbi:MAG TPA: bile acid:sodium symporter family protein [Polyangiaceae bacterium]